MFKSVLSYFKPDSKAANPPEILKCDESSSSIKVNAIADPDHAWDILKNDVKKERIETLKLDTPVFENKVNVKSIFFKVLIKLTFQNQQCEGQICVCIGYSFKN